MLYSIPIPRNKAVLLLTEARKVNSRIPPILVPHLTLPFSSSHRVEPDLQIRTGAKSLSRSREHNTLDALVDVKHRIAELEVMHHLDGERIALFRAIERHDYNGRCDGRGSGIMRDGDMLRGKIGVGFWDRDWRWGGEHCGVGGREGEDLLDLVGFSTCLIK